MGAEAAAIATAVAEAERRRLEEEETARRVDQRQLDDKMVDAYLREKNYADVNALRKSGMFKSKRPLHSAIKDNNAEMVRCLLQANADPSLTDSAGKTARQL